MDGEPRPIRKIISDAKAAQAPLADLPKVEADQNAPPYKPPESLQALTDKLTTHKPPEEIKDTTPDSLDSVKWHMVDEGPAETPPAPHTIAEQVKNDIGASREHHEVRRDEAQQLADKYLEDQQQRYLRDMLVGVARYVPIRDYTKSPEELSVLTIELHDFGLGMNSFSAEEQNIPIAIGNAFQVMRADFVNWRYSEDRASWSSRGIEGPLRADDAATVILQKLKTRVREVRQLNLDVSVMTALSCGDPYTAVRLIQIADQFLPSQGESASGNALTRLTKSFDRVYELYPSAVKDRLDGVLASLGEGPFENLANIPQAVDLKKRSEDRLRKRLTESRDQWYAGQQVAETDLRGQRLDTQHLTEMVEQTVSDGGDWVSVKKAIEERVTRVIDGEVANLIAAELQRRLRPEMSLDEQIKEYKAEATKTGGGGIDRSYYNDFNLYDKEVYGYSEVRKDASTAEKRQKVEGTNYQAERHYVEEIFHPDTIGLKAIVVLLRYPEVYTYNVTKAVADYERRQEQHSDAQTLQTERRRLEEGRHILARKLVGGVSYLQAVAENPETRRILQQEFGLDKLVEPANLEKAAEQLQKMFGEVIDKESGLTLYNSVLKEGQMDEDTRVAEQIAAAGPKDASKLIQQKEGEVVQVVKELAEQAQSEVAELRERKQKLVEPTQQQSEALDRQTALEVQKRKLEATQTVKRGIEKALPANRGKLTDAEKLTKLASLVVSAEALTQELEGIAQRIAAIGLVNDGQIEALSKKIRTLELLKPPTSPQ